MKRVSVFVSGFISWNPLHFLLLSLARFLIKRPFFFLLFFWWLVIFFIYLKKNCLEEYPCRTFMSWLFFLDLWVLNLFFTCYLDMSFMELFFLLSSVGINPLCEFCLFDGFVRIVMAQNVIQVCYLFFMRLVWLLGSGKISVFKVCYAVFSEVCKYVFDVYFVLSCVFCSKFIEAYFEM